MKTKQPQEPKKAHRLKAIEKELSDYVKIEKRNWVRVYQLMQDVEKNELYRERELKSFTAWVNTLATDLGVHVSLLWARLKAGRNYAEYETRAAAAGREVVPLEQVKVSPDTLNLAARVAGKNADEMDKLIDRVIDGELTRADLRAAAQAKRATNTDVVATSRHNRIEKEARGTSQITAGDVVIALRKSPEWLPAACEENKFFHHLYHVFTEFRANTGTTHHARRMDALIAETRTVDNEPDTIVLRGIEIKVAKSDLLNDDKMQEYTSFCDYFYIAIPDTPEMVEAAREVKAAEWGVLTVDVDGNIKVIDEPTQQPAVFRDKTLTNCVLKLL